MKIITILSACGVHFLLDKLNNCTYTHKYTHTYTHTLVLCIIYI